MLVARQIPDSDRDLKEVSPEIFEALRSSEFRDDLFQLFVHPRLSLFSVSDLLTAIPVLQAGLPVSVLVNTMVALLSSTSRLRPQHRSHSS